MNSSGLDFKELQKWFLVAWLLAAGPFIVAALPVPAFEPLRKLILPVLRRGKLLRSSDLSEKGFQTFSVPQSFFIHFYGLGLFWNSLLFFTSLGFAVECTQPYSKEYDMASLAKRMTDIAKSTFSGSSVSGDFEIFSLEAWKLVFLLLLLEMHLSRRLYECLFVSSFDPSARMSLLGYLGGIGYYVMLPLTLFLQSFHDEAFVHAFKGFLTQKLLGKPISSGNGAEIREIFVILGDIGWTLYIGAALILYGSVHQYICHEILASLRQDGLKSESKYSIPKGDWFELVSCAHYLAEIVIYSGLLVASGGVDPAMWVLYLGVVANLYLHAKPTHEWYLSKFDDYPKGRHALFPYIG